ncbi:MAG TPA: family 16 glycosylhydrolase [Acidobacteriaceae bacterium]|nr:family 16 glycosylhydrolase [Acidobacteriaceae bacterium]HUB19689.1 family 16 glycosylhydrolase [Acidobacteriaceae bacterium]
MDVVVPFPASVTRHLFRSSLRAAAAIVLTVGCGGGGSGSTGTGSNPPPSQSTATPTIATAAAQNGAVIVTLSDTTSGATIHYTIDGSTPTSTSPQYFAPFLVASNMTLNAIAAAPPLLNSSVATQTFSANIASGTLVWSDEFSSNTVTSSLQPNPATWTYDTGYQCCGNDEQETYCSWGSSSGPCNPSSPNAAIAPGGGLNIVAENPSGTNYTSARLKSEGLFSFQYGRIEASMQLPESQGMWPAFWLLGNNITTISWPACGEADIMEHIDGNDPPPYVGGTPPGYDWIAGSVHGGTSGSAEVNGTQQYHPTGFSAAAWHTYGMIWTKGQIQYYVDDPTNIYATFNTSNFNGTWPFDQGPMFIILNLAVGGSWPGNVNSSTVFPSTMLVQYVRIYAN